MKIMPPSPPSPTGSLLDRLQPAQRKVLLVGLVFFFFMAASTTLVLAYMVFETQITAWLQKRAPILDASPISQPAQQPVVIIPSQTPSCTGASLQLGTSSWRIEAIQRLTDGSVNVPVDTSGVAYWINDLEDAPVFALSPTQDNLNMLSELLGGEEALLTWANCNTVGYILSAPQPSEPGTDIMTGQSLSGMTVYIPTSPSAPGVMLQGGLVGETITSPATYAPSPSEVDAEISLLETSTSPDGTTIQVEVSILNYGSAPITLSESDITLTPENAAPLALSKSDPKLPERIQPGESQTISLVFPRPITAIAMLKIFTIEYELDSY